MGEIGHTPRPAGYFGEITEKEKSPSRWSGGSWMSLQDNMTDKTGISYILFYRLYFSTI